MVIHLVKDRAPVVRFLYYATDVVLMMSVTVMSTCAMYLPDRPVWLRVLGAIGFASTITRACVIGVIYARYSGRQGIASHSQTMKDCRYCDDEGTYSDDLPRGPQGQ